MVRQFILLVTVITLALAYTPVKADNTPLGCQPSSWDSVVMCTGPFSRVVPQRWECRRLTYVISTANLTPERLYWMQAIADIVENATQLPLDFMGLTDHTPDNFDPAYDITAGFGVSPAQPAGIIGMGGAVVRPQDKFITHGIVYVSPETMGNQSIAMHEWAHAMGLGHVTDPTEIMGPLSAEAHRQGLNGEDVGRLFWWGSGDLQGLSHACSRG